MKRSQLGFVVALALLVLGIALAGLGLVAWLWNTIAGPWIGGDRAWNYALPLGVLVALAGFVVYLVAGRPRR